ncbi:MAG: GDSL-type esterase/lipase family protein [Ruminococcus sp.]|nr:GDSL-type esterase/lipase family protein [Ruminococcus sp.]
MKRKLIAALTSFAMLVTAAVSVPSVSAETGSEESADEIKILPLGDSITDGYQSQDGYRKYLSRDLTEMGYTNIDFVGPKGSDSSTYDDFTYDGNHAGYSGYAIQYIAGTEERQGILETIQDSDMINTYDPDIVLLQIGTNDILSAYNDGITDRLENLVNVILEDLSSDGVIFLASIPDLDLEEIDDWLWAYGELYWSSDHTELYETVQGYIDSYNASIETLVTKLQGEGKNVIFADIHSVIDYETELEDGIHPNETGYEQMGAYWANILSNYIDGNDVTTSTTTTTTTTTTTITTTTTTTTQPTTTTTTSTSTTQPTTTTTTSTSTTVVTTTAPVETTTTTTEPEETDYTVADLVQLYTHIFRKNTTADSRFDLDGNGYIESYDAVLLRKILAK